MNQNSFRFFILIVMNFLVAAAVIVSIFLGKGSPVSPDTYKSLAAKLQATGQNHQAIEAYEKYFETANPDDQLKAKIAFSIGSLYEAETQFEKALQWLYLVEILDPKSSVKADADQKIVYLLERLKKFSAAKLVLDDKTSLQKKEVPESEVLAKIGPKELSINDLNEAMDRAPETVKKKLKDKKAKGDFLRSLVAEELLFQKAERLQLQNDPKLGKTMELIRRQLVVQKLLDDEISKKISVDEKDLKNFFEANKTKYKDFDKNRAQLELDYKTEKAQSIYQTLVEEALGSQQVKLFMEKVK